MARFDVYPLQGTSMLVLDIQSDLFSGIGSRLVIPLNDANEAAREAMSRLKPEVTINGARYRLITTDIAAVPTSVLGEPITNLEDQRGIIIDAVDFLMQGF